MPRASRTGDIDRTLHGRGRLSAAASSAAQQQMRAVARCQLTYEAEHTLVQRWIDTSCLTMSRPMCLADS